MDWQLLLTVTLIAGAGGYLGWRSWRASRKGCAGGCGCHKPAESIDAKNRDGTYIAARELKIRQR